MAKTVGVIGGMGPMATLDFYRKIIKNTKADSDQGHIHVLIDSNPKIPDRTAFILGKGESPLDEIVASAVRLQAAGCDLLAMPCNTAHYFYDDIVEHIGIPLINMVEEVAGHVSACYGKAAKIGLLATIGTYEAGVYEKYFKKYDIDIIVPDDTGKREVFSAIYGVKNGAGDVPVDGVCDVVNSLVQNGVDGIVLGCTELPLLVEKFPSGIRYIDATEILALKVIQMSC
ncbi:MAG: Aspartate racemase [Firmicutes bacterium]|nr:Aspartate racemase [Bacillota bacterium]MDI6706366.1 amino acid racemase [Bacillota bacterium]